MTHGPLPSEGQSQALSELRAVAQLTEGLRIERVQDRRHDEDDLCIDVVVDCRRGADLIPAAVLEQQESVTVAVPVGYPLRRPRVDVDHQRFAHLPHVLWGEGICLYLAADEWDPSRGMQGLVDRLLAWLSHVADGSLTGPDLPWDPPVTDSSQAPEILVVSPDLPAHLDGNPAGWLAWAEIESSAPYRYRVCRWRDEPAEPDPDAEQPIFQAPVLALPSPVDFTYPERLMDLEAVFDGQGVTLDDLGRALDLADELARETWTDPRRLEAMPLPLLLIGSPAPAHTAARSRVAHLATWLVAGSEDRLTWLATYDQRPQVTTRRDEDRPSRWLLGKRIVVLGCGALGAPLAEHCVRGGAAEVALVDHGEVTPGILVRQPYYEDEIGWPKSLVLAQRLGRISRESSVTALPADAVSLTGDGRELPEADLVVDATASPSVAAALERAWWRSDPAKRPALLSVIVGHRCERGAAMLALPRASGAGADVLRRLMITAADDESLHDLLEDLQPDLPRTAVFQPEPGCSDPTYVGSAADLGSFAAEMLTEALIWLGADRPPSSQVFSPSRWATVLRSPDLGRTRVPTAHWEWGNDVLGADRAHGYQIRVDPAAFADIRTEVLRMARDRGPAVETGGLLLGQVDHASRVVWVSETTPFPAGSAASAEALRLDPRAARQAVAARLAATRRLVGFLGAWHTHPQSPALPSSADVEAMEEMAGRAGFAALAMIIGVDPHGRWTQWIDGRGRPEWWAQLYFPPIG